MGDIRTSANASFRDYVTDGLPASGANKPIKSAIRAWGGVIEDRVDDVEAIAMAAAAGLNWTSEIIRVRSTGNVTIASELENGDTLNGVTLATGDHVFLGSQTTASENGLYTVVAAGAASRATFADSAAELARIAFLVSEGTTGAGERWTLPLAAADITVGTTTLTFARVGVEVSVSTEVSDARSNRGSLAARLNTIETRVAPVFRSTVTSSLLTSTILEAQVWGAWDYEDFYINVEFFDFADGVTDKRAQVNVHNSAGTVIANWSRGAINPAAAPEWVFATRVVNGSVQADYQGIVVAFRIDWDAVTAAGWNDALTTFTSAAEAGLERANNYPPSELERFITDFAPYATTTAGTGGTQATVAAAVAALHLSDGTVISRSTFPNSDLSNPATPRQVLVVDAAHDEAITPVTISTIQNGLILPNWSELRAPAGARLYVAAGGDAPVIEMNRPGRICGGFKIENLGDGYGVHIDPDNLTRRAVASPLVLRYRDCFLVEDADIVVHGTASTAIGIGGAIGNGMKALFRRCNFTRGAGTAPLVVFHTTPDTTDAGELGFEECYFEAAHVAVQLLKKHATPTGLRHKVWFRNCEGGAVEAADPDAIGGTLPFVRAGAVTGFTSVSAGLDP